MYIHTYSIYIDSILAVMSQTYHSSPQVHRGQYKDPPEQASSGHYNAVLAPMIYGPIAGYPAVQLLRPTDTTWSHHPYQY